MGGNTRSERSRPERGRVSATQELQQHQRDRAREQWHTKEDKRTQRKAERPTTLKKPQETRSERRFCDEPPSLCKETLKRLMRDRDEGGGVEQWHRAGSLIYEKHESDSVAVRGTTHGSEHELRNAK